MPLDPSDLLVGQITADEIKEFTHGFPNSHRTDSFTMGGCDLEMTFKVPGDKLKPFLQFALGVNYVDTNNDLRRSLPMFHPVHCWAYGRSVKVNGQQYDGDDTDAVIWDFQTTPAKWKQYECVVVFDIPRFKVYSDDEVQYEYQRFVSKEPSSRVLVTSAEWGNIHYDASYDATVDGKPLSGLTPLVKRNGAGVKIKWWHVPAEFVQPDDDTLPVKYLIAQGYCNSSSIFGADTETLLLEEVTFEKYVSPVLTDQLGRLSFMYDITLECLYWKQLDSEMANAAETRRGHNVRIGKGQKYYYVKNGSTGGKLIEAVDFKKLFTRHTDTLP